jgi:hypothetical protein
LFGIVVGISKHTIDQEDRVKPTKVKVCYLNLKNLDLPIVEVHNVKDLIFLISPIEMFQSTASLGLMLKDMDLGKLKDSISDLYEGEAGALEESSEDDEGGNNGGPIIH